MSDRKSSRSKECESLGTYRLDLPVLKAALTSFIDTRKIADAKVDERFTVIGYLIESIAFFAAATSTPEDVEALPVTLGIHLSRRIREQIYANHIGESNDDSEDTPLAKRIPKGSA